VELRATSRTGLVDVVRYASVDDCGRAVNPMLIHGQSHGGIAQGIGQALWEACVYDPGSGQLLSGSFLDYAVIIIAPAEKLVIVRLGFAETPLGDIAAVERLVADAVAALGPAQHASTR
jgi:aerobic carbon-monoxide dehydrogenase large subunit